MLKAIAILGYILTVVGVLGLVLGTATLLIQQLLMLGVLLLVGAAIWKFWKGSSST